MYNDACHIYRDNTCETYAMEYRTTNMPIWRAQPRSPNVVPSLVESLVLIPLFSLFELSQQLLACSFHYCFSVIYSPYDNATLIDALHRSTLPQCRFHPPSSSWPSTSLSCDKYGVFMWPPVRSCRDPPSALRSPLQKQSEGRRPTIGIAQQFFFLFPFALEIYGALFAMSDRFGVDCATLAYGECA